MRVYPSRLARFSLPALAVAALLVGASVVGISTLDDGDGAATVVQARALEATPLPVEAPAVLQASAPGAVETAKRGPATPAGRARAQTSDEPIFARHRVVAYYGNPLASGMGILGEYEPPELIRRLRVQAAAYQEADPSLEVIPALEFIYGVAQSGAGADGLYLGRMDQSLVEQWIGIAADAGLPILLDMQFGRSTVEREVGLMLPFLRYPNVHIALDPEFHWTGNMGPSDLGYLTGDEINQAQALISDYLQREGLGRRMLVVHQFRYDMIRGKESVVEYPSIDLVWNGDGFGSAAEKIDTYNAVVGNAGVRWGGFKLFYQQDRGLMSPSAVLSLTPPPVFVVYQ